jgi:hypothetical protein
VPLRSRSIEVPRGVDADEAFVVEDGEGVRCTVLFRLLDGPVSSWPDDARAARQTRGKAAVQARLDAGLPVPDTIFVGAAGVFPTTDAAA